ncbi:10723_t:CDS:2 [Acaulospora morrowiae]|uniref:10723_t:CDS:1 n=1 Tax=Acaulospora morrowiae TaxID=94023 RepID=A0A9N8ZDG4_9GLOM|nr:10723_t:CDS:2 [Acaulospora morrowiae]
MPQEIVHLYQSVEGLSSWKAILQTLPSPNVRSLVSEIEWEEWEGVFHTVCINIICGFAVSLSPLMSSRYNLSWPIR